MFPTIPRRAASVTIAAVLMLAACATSDRAVTARSEFAGRVALGNDREMYVERKKPTNRVGLDATDLCNPSGTANCNLSSNTLKQNFTELKNEMDRILASEIACPGDGNLDKRVDQRDLQGTYDFAGVGPSFFDFNGDAKTDQADTDIVMAHLNTDCLGTCRRSDLNHDGVVNDADVTLVRQSTGPCDLCGADVNGDGTVDATDLEIVQDSIGCSQ